MPLFLLVLSDVRLRCDCKRCSNSEVCHASNLYDTVSMCSTRILSSLAVGRSLRIFNPHKCSARFAAKSEVPILICEYTNEYSGKEDCSVVTSLFTGCLLYTSDAADERSSVDLGGRRIIKK